MNQFEFISVPYSPRDANSQRIAKNFLRGLVAHRINFVCEQSGGEILFIITKTAKKDATFLLRQAMRTNDHEALHFKST